MKILTSQRAHPDSLMCSGCTFKLKNRNLYLLQNLALGICSSKKARLSKLRPDSFKQFILSIFEKNRQFEPRVSPTAGDVTCFWRIPRSIRLSHTCSNIAHQISEITLSVLESSGSYNLKINRTCNALLL